MSRQARVSVAYATVKVPDGAGKPTVMGFHQGTVFPASADPEDVARLVRRGYAEWVDEPAEEPPVEEPKSDEEPAKPEPKTTRAAKA